MAFSIETSCSGEFTCPKDINSTLEFISNYEKSVGALFYGLESFTRIADSTYHWKFKSLNYKGYELSLQFRTEFKKTDQGIQIIPVKDPTASSLSGAWELSTVSAGCLVKFRASLYGEIPLPFLLKSIVTPLAQKEVSKIFDSYVTNLKKALCA